MGGGGGCGILGKIAGFLGPIGQIFSIASTAMSLFGGGQKSSPAPAIPTPAAPPPAARATGGATVQIGTDANTRVSGSKKTASAASQPKSGDVLAGLGRGGLAL